MSWDLLAPENLQNRHIDHDLQVVYVYMEVLRETTNEEGETVYIEKEDFYPPEEYNSVYYNGPLTRYEPRLKSNSYNLGVYPDVIGVSFQTVKIRGVNEDYKVTYVNKRMLELIKEGSTLYDAWSIYLSEWTGPPTPEWSAEDM